MLASTPILSMFCAMEGGFQTNLMGSVLGSANLISEKVSEHPIQHIYLILVSQFCAMEGCVVGSANFISEKVEFLNVTLFNIHLFPVSQFCAMGGGWSTSLLSSLGPTTDRLATIYIFQ